MTQTRTASAVEALVAAAKAAFPAPDYCPTCQAVRGSRLIIHSFLGFIGADWDYEDVVETIATAKRLQWDPYMGHDLNIITADDQEIRFEIAAPEEET